MRHLRSDLRGTLVLPGLPVWVLWLVLLLVSHWAADARVRLVFFEDFSQATAGTVPDGWYTNFPANVAVVTEPFLESGMAVHVRAGSEQERDTHFRGPVWDLNGSDPVVVAVEFQVHWLAGRGIHVYASSPQGHHVNLQIGNGGVLRYRIPDEYVEVAPLAEGWNSIRFIAHRERNEVYVYLNDWQQPVAGPYPFRTPLESWEGVYMLVLHSYLAAKEGPEPEALYGNFKVWALD